VFAAILVILPLAARLVGWGPTYTMYASSVWFRVDVIAEDAGGHAYPLAPTELAQQVTPSAVPFLAGGDHFRRTYDVAPLRHHLDDLARLACKTQHGRAKAVSMTLFERTYRAETPRTSRVRVVCES